MSIKRHVAIGDLGCIIYLDDDRVIFCHDTTYRLVTADHEVKEITQEKANALTEGQDWEADMCYQEPIPAEYSDYESISYCKSGEPFTPCWWACLVF